ncbi:MAG TPA: hypothetical protein VJ810_00730 [Blastocatellia bacterium]|nr:hypothetical protein [Blastocatellia bacterium]
MTNKNISKAQLLRSTRRRTVTSSKPMISLVGIAGMKTYDYESHHDFAVVSRAAYVYGSSLLKAAPLPVGDLVDYTGRHRLFL